MADYAFETRYREEFVYAYEDRLSVLAGTTTREAQVKGNQAVFLLANSGSAQAQSRGTNGLIPARADNLTQVTCTLAEWHDLVRKTNFNLFASQGDGRRIMQETTMSVINRKIDDLVIAQLDTATNDTGTAAQANLNTIVYAQTILGNNFVDITDEDNLFALVSPAFRGYMMQVTEFTSGDYVQVQPLNGPARRYWRFMGFNWITHPRLTNSIGAGGTSASEQCYFYHRSALGTAEDTAGMDNEVGYDKEQGYSFARVSIHMGAKLLQNAGVVQVKHDGSGFAAQ